MSRLFLVAALSVTASACSAAEPEAPKGQAPQGRAPAVDTAAPASSVAPSTATPSQAAPPLSAYVGKYPYDAVDGVKFMDHPLVRAAMERSGAPAAALDFLRDDDNVVVPIREVDGRLMSRSFEAASGGDVNGGILISLDGRRGAVCYSTGVEPDVSGADWYIDGEKAFTRYEMCPSEAEDLTGFGNWPIGPIPG